MEWKNVFVFLCSFDCPSSVWPIKFDRIVFLSATNASAAHFIVTALAGDMSMLSVAASASALDVCGNSLIIADVSFGLNCNLQLFEHRTGHGISATLHYQF